MKTINYLTRTFSALRRLRAKRNSLTPLTNELVHPRFGLTASEDTQNQKKAPNSLLFLMYSKENETLFI
ncbi:MULTISPECIES: hypothetical protein [Flavobacterium]|uniref:Uncharacterized protein n=2 Tax=Flavobacterium TaxID=237 RepID=A0A941AYI6_9FLAO|nr:MULTISPECIES: hypothetical protein [Flavobacterium]MBP4139421.1 hypothetical protein [Flavobacterium geliluteum]MDX6181375.1 hypothetical protein [Flavobacterium sp. Fl-33]MDX6184977.1 hypothetical protein [Flavobacterium sp. Fl-77]UFH40069.1 hypothetical protein LNP22_07280 [Flavobacterium sp. F-70]